MSRDVFQPPGDCPVCGEEVPTGAKSCPSCGADERTGWSEYGADYDGLDLPDEAYAKDSDSPPQNRWHQSALWVGVALALLLILVVAFTLR